MLEFPFAEAILDSPWPGGDQALTRTRSASRCSTADAGSIPAHVSDCKYADKCRRLLIQESPPAPALLPRKEIRLPSGRTIMMSYSSAPRSLLLAGAFSVHSRSAQSAQQPASPPAAAQRPPPRRALPPGSPMIGRPRQRGRRQAGAGRAAADCRRTRQTADCQSSRCRPASTSRSMPPAWRTRVRWRKATRARCSSAAASSTRSMPSSTRTANARSR